MQESEACEEEGNQQGTDMEKKGAKSRSRKIEKISISGERESNAATNYQNAGSSLSVTPGMMTHFPRPEPSKQVALTQSTLTYVRRRASASGGRSYAKQSKKSQLGGLQSTKTPTACPSVGEAGDSEDFRCPGLTIPPCISEDERSALFHAPLIPPVTKKSLEELDLMYIQSNINLRVDINYDHDLHFMPVSGQKGEQKRLEARKYWLSLAAELRIMNHHSVSATCSECSAKSAQGSSPWPEFRPRLPLLFLTLKELLTILVPDRDQDQIAQYIDIPLLVQEASYGVLDVVKMAQWLCELLTTHCAPMRDTSAQEMAERVKEGAENGDLFALVDGIEKLFAFLEAMKLDVANHQIRSFRFHLIEDTVAFQQEFFRGRIRNNKLNADPQRHWFTTAVMGHQTCQVGERLSNASPIGSFLHALAWMCVAKDPEYPETLKHDTIRLQALRDEIQDIIHIDICLAVFDQQIRRLVGRDWNASAMHSTLQARIMDGHQTVQSRIMDLTDGHTGQNMSVAQMWREHGTEIALELTRAAFSICKRVGRIIPDSEITDTTNELLAAFDEESKHGRRAQKLAEELESAAQGHARVFQNMTTLMISEKQKQWHHIRQQDKQWSSRSAIEDIARKLAHVGIIHMRVWWDIVYLPRQDEHEPGVGGLDENMHSENFALMVSSDFVQQDDTPDSPMELSEE